MTINKNTVMIILLVIGVIWLFGFITALGSLSIIQTNGQSMNLNWQGQVQQFSTACSATGMTVQYFEDQIIMQGSFSGSCNQDPRDSFAEITTNLGDWEEVQAEVLVTHTVEQAGSSSDEGNNAYNVNGLTGNLGPGQASTQGFSGTMTWLKNNEGEVDIFLKRCASCSNEFLQTSSYNEEFRVWAKTGFNGNQGTNDIRITLSEFEVVRGETPPDSTEQPQDPPTQNSGGFFSFFIEVWNILINFLRGVF